MTLLHTLTSSLTSGDDDALAVLIHHEDDWAALAVKPKGVLLVLWDARDPKESSWEEIARRSSEALLAQKGRTLDGLASAWMVVGLVGSALSAEELEESPSRIEALGRAVRWIVVRSDRPTYGDRHPAPNRGARQVFSEVENVIRLALIRRPPADETSLAQREEAGRRLLVAEATARSRARIPLATATLGAIFLGVFGLETASGYPVTVSTLRHLGGLNRALVLGGEFERLLASSLLHGGFLHLASNIVALGFFGSILERFLGAARIIVLFSAAALGGALACLFFGRPDVIAVGASGGIFGIMGAICGLGMRESGLFGMKSASLRSIAFASIAQNIVFSLGPGVSLLGHVGGALTGLALGASGLLSRGLVQLASATPTSGRPSSQAAYQVASLGCLLAFILSLAVATSRGDLPPP